MELNSANISTTASKRHIRIWHLPTLVISDIHEICTDIADNFVNVDFSSMEMLFM